MYAYKENFFSDGTQISFEYLSPLEKKIVRELCK